MKQSVSHVKPISSFKVISANLVGFIAWNVTQGLNNAYFVISILNWIQLQASANLMTSFTSILQASCVYRATQTARHALQQAFATLALSILSKERIVAYLVHQMNT